MPDQPSLRQSAKIWGKIGVLSFGGPAAQVAMMHKEVVEDRGWLGERQFLNALNFCMLLPGPEAMQLATYMGLRLNGFWGGIIAGSLFVIPGAIVILALASVYAFWGEIPLVNALFLGIKATVVVIVIEALLRISKKALHTRLHWIIAAIAFVGIFVFTVPYPLIVLAAGVLGCFALKDTDAQPATGALPPLYSTLKTISLFLILWWAPVLVLYWVTDGGLLSQLAAFFSKLAVVTFGGAYAVLAYMAQDVVGLKGWLTAGEMMDGLGLAETTPGPLILVTEFVGFMAGFNAGGWGLGVAAALVTLWVTFIPCFLWIFAGAPYLDWISAQPRLHGGLSAITAAVVGVILNLSIWFALHVFFDVVTQTKLGIATLWVPTLSSINPSVIILTALAAYLLLLRHWNILKVLGLCAAVSASLSLI